MTTTPIFHKGNFTHVSTADRTTDVRHSYAKHAADSDARWRGKISLQSGYSKPRRHEEVAQLSENISPYNFFLVPESLGMCIDGSADYEQCGSRDPNDPNFIHNAKVNISRIEKRIAELKSGRFPEELKPVVDYFLNILTTFLAEDVADLKYIQSGRVSDLAFVANGVDYGTACNDLRDKFQASEDKVAAFNKVRHDWHNCVNQAFTQNHGYSYPKAAWESFLKRYSIDQRFVPTEVN